MRSPLAVSASVPDKVNVILDENLPSLPTAEEKTISEISMSDGAVFETAAVLVLLNTVLSNAPRFPAVDR